MAWHLEIPRRWSKNEWQKRLLEGESVSHKTGNCKLWMNNSGDGSVEKKRSCQRCHQFWYRNCHCSFNLQIIFNFHSTSLYLRSFTIPCHHLFPCIFLHKFTQMHCASKNCHYSVNIRGCLLLIQGLIDRFVQKVDWRTSKPEIPRILKLKVMLYELSLSYRLKLLTHTRHHPNWSNSKLCKIKLNALVFLCHCKPLNSFK